MSVKVANSRLIVPSLKRYAGFYQQLLKNVSGFQDVGKRLIHLAETGRVLRQTEQVEESAYILSNLPFREYQLIGRYYLGVCDYRRGELEKTQRIFEQVAEASSLPGYYRSRAMLSLAAIAADKGDYVTELYFGLESLKVSSDFSLRLEALKGIAVIKAKKDCHPHALKDLEGLIPYLRFADPLTCSDCLNSLAVELGEEGRIEEAQNVCRIVLASPFIFSYPEWRETWQDLSLRGYKSRSVVLVPKLPVKVKVKDNVIPIPVNNNPTLPQKGRGKVLDLQKLRKKMVKEPNEENGEENKKLSDKQMVMKIMEYATDDDMPDEALFEMLESIKKISRSYKSKKGKD